MVVLITYQVTSLDLDVIQEDDAIRVELNVDDVIRECEPRGSNVGTCAFLKDQMHSSKKDGVPEGSKLRVPHGSKVLIQH